MNELRGNQIQFVFGGASGVLPLARDGQLRALTVTSSHRLTDAPDIPTLNEAGVPGYEVTVWNAVLAPKGTQAAVVEQLNQIISAAAIDLTDRFRTLGGQPLLMTPAQFQALIETDIVKWQAVITQANVHVD
jgi:tripartite-type tricarboxylate transporter receptor subunit TctC